MKDILERLPIVGSLARNIKRKTRSTKKFDGSQNYWENRYVAGGNSGDGSYRLLAEFKAEVINDFVERNNVATLIEYGCGDGNQLSLANYKNYTGFDVSNKVLALCEEKFRDDPSKTFKAMDSYDGERAELTMSLDVIYHLVEDDIYADYMNRLFDSADRFVIVYASNTDQNPDPRPAHVRHRAFSQWVSVNKSEWQLLEHIPNRYPYQGDNKSGSFADFYLYEKSQETSG